MNDPVIERVAREDPARREPATDAADATRTRVFTAIDHDQPRFRRSVPRRTGMLLTGAAAMAAVVAVAVVALVAAANHPSGAGRIVHKGQHATRASAKPVELHIAGVVHLGQRDSPEALLAQGSSLWVATPYSVVRLNLRDGQRIAAIPIPDAPIEIGLTAGAGSIWLAPTGTSQLLRIDPSTNRLLDTIRVGVNHDGLRRSLGGGVAFAGGRVWVSRVSNRPRGDLVALDPSTDQPVGAPITVGSGPDTVVSAFGSLWVDNTSVTLGVNAPSRTYPAMSRVNPQRRQVSTEPFSGTPASGFGSMWIQSDAGDDNAALLRVDPATGRTLARVAVPRVVGVAFAGGRVWAICDERSHSSRTFQPLKGTATLRQLDPHSNRLIGKPIPLRIRPNSIVASHGQLWIAGSGQVTHWQLMSQRR